MKIFQSLATDPVSFRRKFCAKMKWKIWPKFNATVKLKEPVDCGSVLFGQVGELIIFTVCQIVFSLKWCIGWVLLLLGSWKLFHLLSVIHFSFCEVVQSDLSRNIPVFLTLMSQKSLAGVYFLFSQMGF